MTAQQYTDNGEPIDIDRFWIRFAVEHDGAYHEDEINTPDEPKARLAFAQVRAMGDLALAMLFLVAKSGKCYLLEEFDPRPQREHAEAMVH